LRRLRGGWWNSTGRTVSTYLGPDSDLDFCVVLPDDAPESLYRDQSIHRRLMGLQAVDVVRLPRSDFDARCPRCGILAGDRVAGG
jgi:hypothetical protein